MPRHVFIHLELAALALSGICLAAPTAGHATIVFRRPLVHDIVAPRILLIAEHKTFWIEPISGESGTALPVFVTLPEGVRYAPGSARKPAYLLFRNVPPTISFSVGFRLKGNWAVGLGDINKITMLSAPGYVAEIHLEAVLYLGGDQEPMLREISIELYPPAKRAEPATTAAIDTEIKESPQAISSAMVPAESVELLRRGDMLLSAGDFESARLVYSELASQGNAQAALLMARTYDPDVLRNTFIVGLKPDAEQAMLWYRKAADLGDTIARQHLDRLADKR